MGKMTEVTSYSTIANLAIPCGVLWVQIHRLLIVVCVWKKNTKRKTLIRSHQSNAELGILMVSVSAMNNSKSLLLSVGPFQKLFPNDVNATMHSFFLPTKKHGQDNDVARWGCGTCCVWGPLFSHEWRERSRQALSQPKVKVGAYQFTRIIFPDSSQVHN